MIHDGRGGGGAPEAPSRNPMPEVAKPGPGTVNTGGGAERGKKEDAVRAGG